MENQLLTLSKIFTERLFRIPDYQRGYAWTDKQLNDFWNDLEQIKEKENHYTGVLTLEEVPEDTYKNWENDFWIINSRNYVPYYIVDGQQRLTTSIILIQCILEKIKDNEQLNFTDKDDIVRKFIFDSKDKKITRSYIFGYEHDNPSYEFLITKIFNEKIHNNSYKETIYTQNLLFAKEFFIKKIHDFSIEDLEILYKKITQQLLFNNFTITKDVDVCVAFETMNNRGKALSYLELLKNRLIYLSLKIEEDDDDKNKLRKTINECWKTIYHNLGKNKDNPLDDDMFLQFHYLITFGEKLLYTDNENNINFKLPRNRANRDFHTHELLETKFITKNVFLEDNDPQKLTLEKIYEYTQSLQENVEIWYSIWNPMDSSYSLEEKIYLDKLLRINSPIYYLLIMVFFQKNKTTQSRLDLLKIIEKLAFILKITDRYTLISYANYRSTTAFIVSLTTDLRKGLIDCDHVINNLNDLFIKIKSSNVLLHLKDSFKNSNFYHWDLINYFFFEYNLSLQDQSKTSRSKLHWSEFIEQKEDFYTIEHVYPQRARSPAWKNFESFKPNEKKLLRNSLGNLLPLSSPKNSSLSNRPFSEKVNGVKGSYSGYRYGCYAENEVCDLTDWSPEVIKDRGIKLLTFMEKRWDIKLGTKKEKIELLGLEFLDD